MLALSFLPLSAEQISKAKPFKRLGTQRSVDVQRLPKGEPGRQRGAKKVHRRPTLPKRPHTGRSVRAHTRDASAPAPQMTAKAPVLSFEGLADDNTAIPPDTMGAVGLGHVMTTLNTQFRVQSRTGTTLTTVAHDAFWQTTGAFDPKVFYDHDANRWIVVALDGAWEPTSSLLIAVSDSADPTGTWTIHDIPADQNEIGAWGDFPIAGFNGTYFVVTLNMFEIAGAGDFAESAVFVFDKAALYADTIDGVFHTSVYDFCMAPAVSFDGDTGPVYLVESGWPPSTAWLLTVDDQSLDFEGEIQGLSWDYWAGNFAPQAGGNLIDLGDDRMTNAVLQNGWLYASQTAFLPAQEPTTAVAQWWRIKPDLNEGAQYRIASPATGGMLAYPSIAVNEANDVVIGYSAFSPSSYASAAYSYRRASDSPGLMSAPHVFKSGEANYYKTYGGFYNRWGDYSATVVDPLDDMTFWTIQEYAESPINSESQWGTWWAKIVTAPFAAPANLTATASGTTSVGVSWSAVGDITHYQLERSSNGAPYAGIGGALVDPVYTDMNVTSNTTYLYRVRAMAGATPSGYSNVDPATTIVFTDNP
ncbi:MAG TPA: fibronectin type III domain-containing protein, partial [Thermoanaerobaculia bacterium]|nr:fibronectin type III domain-containing protein [Thermoanaerobaculia bacterium]